MTLRAVAADGHEIDLTEHVKDGQLDWTAPPGDVEALRGRAARPGEKVKRAAPGGDGNVLDPFSTAKLDRYLSVFDKAFADFKGASRGSSSTTPTSTTTPRGPTTFRRVRKRRGYDLRDHLPALFGDGDQRHGRPREVRLPRDALRPAPRLRRPLDRVGARPRQLTRNQAHGGPANLLDAYAAADIPEMEVFAIRPRSRCR